jgi:hypothetical protein
MYKIYFTPMQYMAVREGKPTQCVVCRAKVDVGDIYMYTEGHVVCAACLKKDENPDYLWYIEYLTYEGVLDQNGKLSDRDRQ